jgi:hypothetical protein
MGVAHAEWKSLFIALDRYKRLERWADPDSEELEHQAGRSGVVDQVATDADVDEACEMLPFAQISCEFVFRRSLWCH